jgi:hypothetical protein
MGVRSLIEHLMISKVGDLGACLGNGPSGWFETVHGLGGLIAHHLTLLRLWTVQIIAHSALTVSRPRRRNWRKPRACLI